MTERFYSYREFARIVGISPQTLSELIKKNKVHVNSAGQVPESEVEYFIRRKLKKGLEEGSAGSFLYITVGKTGEELQAYKERFGDQMIEVTSIEDLVEEARQSLFRIKTDGATVNRIHRQYTVSILKELVKRSHEAALRCISRCADLPEINRFSLVSLYEMFMYDHLYTDKGNEEEIRQCLSKGVLSDGSSPLGTMEAAYKSIVVSLHIVADKISKRPLISRADWNPDTVQMIRGMSDGGNIPDNDFIKKFFTMSLIPDLKTRSRKDGLEALKILRTVQTKTASKDGLSKVFDTGLQGYCTFFNVSEETTEQEVQALISNINQEYYKVIEIEAPGGSLPDGFPDMLRVTLSICNQNHTAVVRTMRPLRQ